MFFSTFEELKLPATAPMDSATTNLYKQSPTPNPTSCGTSRLAHFGTGSPMQSLWMAVEKATCKRSTHGCGSLGAGGLASGVCLCLRLRRGARRLSGRPGRRGVKRPAAAARQRGAEMNEAYGTRTLYGYHGISQVMQVYDSYTQCLSRDMQVLKTYPCISRVMQV